MRRGCESLSLNKYGRYQQVFKPDLGLFPVDRTSAAVSKELLFIGGRKHNRNPSKCSFAMSNDIQGVHKLSVQFKKYIYKEWQKKK